MVEARAIRGPLPRAWTLATVAAAGLSTIGCTMCPDPFDYSGPVPNGSSPQNDFRARSNGILPLGVSPRPWPLIVKEDAPPPADEPAPTLADEPDADTLQQTGALMGESEEDSGATDGPAATQAEDAPQPTLEPVPAVAQPTDATDATDAQDVANGDAEAERSAAEKAPQAVPQPPFVPLAPPVPAGETPGWRSRRR